MELKLKLTEEQKDLVHNWNICHNSNGTYIFMPHVLFKPTDEEYYQQVEFKNSPFVVKEFVADCMPDVFTQNIYRVLAAKIGLIQISDHTWVNKSGKTFTCGLYGFIEK